MSSTILSLNHREASSHLFVFKPLGCFNDHFRIGIASVATLASPDETPGKLRRASAVACFCRRLALSVQQFGFF